MATGGAPRGYRVCTAAARKSISLRLIQFWPAPCYLVGFASLTVAKCFMFQPFAFAAAADLVTSPPGNSLFTPQIILGIITVLASGVVSAVVTFRLNRSHQQELLYRQKLEELYLNAIQFLHSLQGAMKDLIPSDADADQFATASITAMDQLDKKSFSIVRMLTSIYFPEMLFWVAVVERTRQQIFDRLFEYVDTFDNQADSAALRNDLMQFAAAINHHDESLTKYITKHGQSLVKPKGFFRRIFGK